MPRSIILLLLLALSSYRGLAETGASTNKLNTTAFPNDIRFDDEPVVTGSGSGKIPFSDDEDFGESGSGSGSGLGDIDFGSVDQTTPKAKITTMETTSTTTKAPLSPCERERQINLRIGRKSIPNCEDGVYASMQCDGSSGESDCWCSDTFGKGIPGTNMEAPNIPDCDFGINLPPCLFQLVTAMRQELLGGSKPKCTTEGQFNHIQCMGSVCYCVDKDTGARDTSTMVNRPEIPRCFGADKETGIDDVDEGPTFEPTDSSESSEEDNSIHMLTPDNGTPDLVIPNSEDTDLDKNFSIDKNENIDNNDEKESKYDVDGSDTDDNQIDQIYNENIESGRQHEKETKIKATSQIMSQPGLLAGIIGGSVVLALCLVLLIMFIIYRMRKKDEGSYPLDEPRKPPKYPYMRAPEREFYA